ncbi:hypothetical protein NQ317_014364 [Molorchus minor]|uniref:Nucleolar protein 6 n=1 Tax=Molorchus minor TaxID=1323400 RepID=A0ABQ9K5X8_9CUCU|nr:hypothetical protein NQ317_014364 [Molorchus minor]
MSSYQVVRSFWSFLSTTDLEEEAISIGEASTEVLENFKKNFDVVLLDKSGCYNVCAFLNVEVYRKVKTESQFAIKLLDDNKNDSFHKLFLMKYPFFLQYDLVIDLTKSLPLKKYSIKVEELAKNIGYKNLIIIKNISKIIQKGLGKRILNFVPRLELETDGFVFEKLFFGVNLNPDEAFNILELGPSLNDHIAAAEFRSFWGHLSSDRRFRDGSTNVAVHFKTNTIKAKRGIIRKILNFIIGEKLELKFDLHYDELEEILAIKKIVPSYPSGTNEETTLKIIQASDEIGKQLRSMQMSLKITGVQGITDTFCFADMFPQIPTNYEVGKVTTVRDNSIVFSTEKCEVVPRFIKPVECVLQLEHSSKWPNDLEALHHIKTSFYLEISRNLQSHKIISHVTPEFLDVFFQGLVFRYRLYVPKEVTLVKKSITENGITSFRDSLHSFNLENVLNVTPKIVGALKGVQSLYPSFGPGTALVKRWLRSQLIDDYYFPDIVIDLLNASLYLNNSFSPSNTPQISFLRFLKFFSEFDWNLQTVLVNFNEDITNEEIVALETKLQQNRDGYQPLYIITSFDQGLSVFTKYVPSKEILYRVKELTKISLNFIGNIHMGLIHTGIKELFIPNLEGYNLLIHLRSQMNSRRHEQIVFGNVTNRVIVEKYKKNSTRQIADYRF